MQKVALRWRLHIRKAFLGQQRYVCYALLTMAKVSNWTYALTPFPQRTSIISACILLISGGVSMAYLQASVTNGAVTDE